MPRVKDNEARIMHKILYCSDENIRRAVRTDCVARPASGCPRPPQRTAESTFAGAFPSRALTGRRFRRFVTRTYA